MKTAKQVVAEVLESKQWTIKVNAKELRALERILTKAIRDDRKQLATAIGTWIGIAAQTP